MMPWSEIAPLILGEETTYLSSTIAIGWPRCPLVKA